MSLFNRSKMRAVFAAVVGAAMGRAPARAASLPPAAPAEPPKMAAAAFDPFAFFRSDHYGAFGIDPRYAPGPGEATVLARLAVWERRGSRAYRWCGGRPNRNKRRAPGSKWLRQAGAGLYCLIVHPEPRLV